MLGGEKEKKRVAVHWPISILIGILKNENGAPEDEENFEEAIKNVNTALNTTQVFKELLRDSVKKGVFWSPYGEMIGVKSTRVKVVQGIWVWRGRKG